MLIIRFQIESQQVCEIIDKNSIVIDGLLNSSGLRQTGSWAETNYGITDYIKVSKSIITTLVDFNNSEPCSCFYNVNKELISCVGDNTFVVNSNVNIPNNAVYVRFSIYKGGNRPQFKLCKNGNQAISDTVSDDSVDDPSGKISQFEDMLPENGVITQLIGLPITLYTKVLNSINGTCNQFNLGTLYNTALIIPCIDISTYLGSTIWTTIDLIISGAFVLVIAKKMIKAFENFTSMKEGDVIND